MGRGKYLRYIASLLGRKNPDMGVLNGMLQNESLREVKRVARVVQEHKHDIQKLGDGERGSLVSNMIYTIKDTKRPQNIPVNIEIRCFGESETLGMVSNRPESDNERDTEYNGGASGVDTYDGPTHQEY